jgi:predicted nucleic-acid-binding protein
MIAVDTNVLARYVTNDDPAQSAKALQVMMHEDIFIPKTRAKSL